MTSNTEDINLLLREIEQELKCIDLGIGNTPYSAQLPFQSWVQSVMVPAFDQILNRHGGLPESCKIKPNVNLPLAELPKQTDHLLTLIEQLELIITEKSTTKH